jgi:hypothetical protein
VLLCIFSFCYLKSITSFCSCKVVQESFLLSNALSLYCVAFYGTIYLLLTLSSGKEVTYVFYLFSFLISVAAGVVSYYICKWLDGDQ